MTVVKVSAEKLRRELTHILNRVGYGGDQVIVRRHNEEIVAIVPIQLYERLGLSEWARSAADSEPDLSSQEYAPFEEVPQLAEEIESARIAAGLSYDDLAAGLQAERQRTLRERYPDFAERYEVAQST